MNLKSVNQYDKVKNDSLPEMSGFKLPEHLVKSHRRIPVIFITGHDRDRMEDEAMRLGTVAYLRKPFDEQCLLDAIRSLARRGLNSGKEVVPF